MGWVRRQESVYKWLFFFFNDNVQRKSTAAELCVEQVWWVMAASRLTDHADHAEAIIRLTHSDMFTLNLWRIASTSVLQQQSRSLMHHVMKGNPVFLGKKTARMVKKKKKKNDFHFQHGGSVRNTPQITEHICKWLDT